MKTKEEKVMEELLKEVDKLFPTKKKEKFADSFSFDLGRFQRGFWQFSVIDDWHKWLDKGFELNFIGNTPQEAILKFLDYIEENKINIKDLSNLKEKEK